ncbi:hypothetical protein N7468_008877 [Penicillium chermesinum]|uniref:Uncharacterized protein n=1 Tax=Penicillium chermesinum TaxID=63820 RepID=A0A9W9NH64_9EURO|nr:uncharacterized protein N7468_008877 [Penicillium chermesinum]KAJ5219673.1 hypothetical protein N7468_008877 [Penicillium chermesinum]KAJ6153674.1 hypothetical protein N7470_006633 [Penicillium chermesinum]
MNNFFQCFMPFNLYDKWRLLISESSGPEDREADQKPPPLQQEYERLERKNREMKAQLGRLTRSKQELEEIHTHLEAKIRQQQAQFDKVHVKTTAKIKISEEERASLERLLHQQEEEFKRKLGEVTESLSISQKKRSTAEEKARRQGELYYEAQKSADNVLLENDKLLNQISKFRCSNRTLDDDDVASQLRGLNQRLEKWIRFHFAQALLQPSAAGPGSSAGAVSGISERLRRSHEIFSHLSNKIFITVLEKFMVGVNSAELALALRIIHEKVQELQPEFLWKNWHFATNAVLPLLLREDLEWSCNEVILFAESYFAGLSHTDRSTRICQLRDLIWGFIDFKQKLQQQSELYEFRWVQVGCQFSKGAMSAITGEGPDDGIVEYCISPSLYKRTPGKSGVVVEKARVKLRAHVSHAMLCGYPIRHHDAHSV